LPLNPVFYGRTLGDMLTRIAGSLVLVLIAEMSSGGEPLVWFQIRSNMEPTIQSGRTVGVDRQAYKDLKDVRRGDVIAFRYPENPESMFVGRVIGMPLEHVSLKDGRVAINRVPLAVSGRARLKTERAGGAKYLTAGAGVCEDFADQMSGVRLPKGAFFILGDNRCSSRDSRYWGHLEFSFIVGKVVQIR
jgi:signal peptidase I